MAKSKSTKRNKSDFPLKHLGALSGEVAWAKYEHKSAFKYVCEAAPNRKEERLEVTGKTDLIQRPCVYVAVIARKVFKIGVASSAKNRGGVEGRVGSYNSGTAANMKAGTCSVTNNWALQTFLNLGEKIRFYGYFPEMKSFRVFGEKVTDASPSPKAIETVLIRQFEKKYGKKPIGNTQG